MPINYQTQPSGPLHGTIHVPGDKSISHRALMLGAIAEGITHISGFLSSKDTLATLNIFRALGVIIEHIKQNEIIVQGVGLHGLKVSQQALDCENSGTSMRLLMGLLSAQAFYSELIGDGSLSKRPMQRVINPLKQMGANIAARENNFAPIKILPAKQLQEIEYQLPVASAQVKSAILLASLYATGKTTVIEGESTRDHTERMLNAFGYPIEIISTNNNKIITLIGKQKLIATNISIPTDISSAAFFIVAASICPNSEIILTDVGINPTRTGVIEILKLMGANIHLQNERLFGSEPVADIHIRHAKLHGIEIPQHLVALAIDEFPVLFIAAANADGKTILTGAAELRVKESDRIQVMADGLRILGVNVEVLPDGIQILGGKYHGGKIESHGDHRIAMAFAIAGITTADSIEIMNCNNVATSFPSFVELAQKCGIYLKTSMES